MAKEAYYFSHDSNARNDEKIIKLRMKHGWQGFGIYWAIIEKLRDSADYYLANDYDLIAFEFTSHPELIKSIIEDFALFIFSENNTRFTSNSLLERMKLKEEKSTKARDSISKRWGKENNTNVLRTNNDSNTRKAKEKKEKEILVPEELPVIISKIKVIEFLKQSAFISTEEAGREADKLMAYYKGQRITNLKKVCSKWAENLNNSSVMPEAAKSINSWM